MDHDPASGADDHAPQPSDLAWPWGPESGQPNAPQRPPGRPPAGWTRKVGLGVAAVGLAGGVFGIAWAVTSSSGGSSSATSAPAAASQSASSGDPSQSLADPAQAAPGPGQGGPGRFGFGFRGPFGGAGQNGQQNGNKPPPSMAGTVKSVSGQTVTIQDYMGFTRTIHTSSSTTYTRGGQSANSTAVTNGAQIAARGTVDKNGTDLDASKVAVLLPTVTGTVQSVSGQSFVVQGFDGATHTVTTTGSTTFRQRGSQASLSDVKQGVRVAAMGDRQSNGDINATTVQILPAGQQHQPNGTPPAPPGGGSQSGSTT
ncbi:MAG TPA: DUF5666 domain-containing protein [Acidimicrobiales bacterium]